MPKSWHTYPLKDICTSFVSGGTPSTQVAKYWKGNIPWVTSADFGNLKIVGVRKYISEEGLQNSAASIIKQGDLLVVTRVGVGKLAIAPFDIAISQDTTGISPNRCLVDPVYLLFALSQNIPKLIQFNQGTSINGVTRNDLKQLSVLLPPLPEQRKIAEILSNWDKAIELVSKQIEGKQRLKKGLMQQLLVGKIRFTGLKGKWKEKNLGQFLKLKLRKVEKPKEAYLRLGIRSHGKGTFTTTVEDPETVDMTHLYQVKKGDLIVSITFAWEGAIAMVESDGDGAYVSHRFPTFEFNTQSVIPEFFRYLMHTPRFFYELGVVSPGGAGRNRVMSKSNFLEIKVSVPPIEEQRIIGGVLTALDAEINGLKVKLELLKKQKQGMMQKLLTGEVRVKVN